MKFNAIKSLIGAVAPTIGTALGGPMGGMAANMIAEVLGVPNTPKAINKALTDATPEQMLQLKQAEQAFEVQMKELEVDVFSLEVQDKQDARGKFSRDWTARIMGHCSSRWIYGIHIPSHPTTTRTKQRSIN
jgi:hypothetical protein